MGVPRCAWCGGEGYTADGQVYHLPDCAKYPPAARIEQSLATEAAWKEIAFRAVGKLTEAQRAIAEADEQIGEMISAQLAAEDSPASPPMTEHYNCPEILRIWNALIPEGTDVIARVTKRAIDARSPMTEQPSAEGLIGHVDSCPPTDTPVGSPSP